MADDILFLTGRLAHDSLCRELEALPARAFTYRVHDIGIKVAALMTTAMICRRLKDAMGAARVIVPGLCVGDLAAVSAHLGVPVERGPKDLKDLPEYFGFGARQADLSQHDVTLFAEIVDAHERSMDGILAQAEAYRDEGADVIDLGCLPGKPFPRLAEAVRRLKERGYRVSVDSLHEQELLEGGRAGADFLLSLRESTLWIADEVTSVPVLIPETHGDLDSLCRAARALGQRGRAYLADPILDPIHFGFTDAVVRYKALRERLPEAPLMMGVGNVTELTDADTTGITAILMGIVSELHVAAILTTQVSPHARSAVREADLARRIMHAARRERRLPQRYHPGLMAHRDRKPFPHSAEEIRATAQAVRDPSFRIQLSVAGIHVFNRDGIHQATDPYALYAQLGVEHDGSHAFYLGVELARAQIAWQLGKRYMQDRELAWGCVVPASDEGLESHEASGPTMKR